MSHRLRVWYIVLFLLCTASPLHAAELTLTIANITDNAGQTMIAVLASESAFDEDKAPPAQVAEPLQAALQAAGQSNLQWIRAGRGEAVQLVAVSAVVYFKADNKYTTVVTVGQEHLIRTSISELENRHDPERFWRIHWGLIVNVEEIIEARRNLRGRFNLSLRSRPETLRVSQGHAHLFKQM